MDIPTPLSDEEADELRELVARLGWRRVEYALYDLCWPMRLDEVKAS